MRAGKISRTSSHVMAQRGVQEACPARRPPDQGRTRRTRPAGGDAGKNREETTRRHGDRPRRNYTEGRVTTPRRLLHVLLEPSAPLTLRFATSGRPFSRPLEDEVAAVDDEGIAGVVAA